MQVDIFKLKQTIIEAGEIAALSIMRLQNPAFDEVKFKEAVEIAGSERWLKYHIKKGTIKGRKRGTAKNSPIYYSRLEIAAVKKAERIEAKII